MTKINSILLLAVLFLAACNSRSNEVNTIQQLADQLRQQKDAKLDTVAAKALIEKSLAFAAAHPQDTLAPAFLFQAADVSRGIGKFEEAVTLWGRVNAEYATYHRAPDALFLQGFTCDKDLGDAKRALAYYQSFADRYRKHPLAADAKISIQYLESGKTPEELIKSFEKPPVE